MPLPPPGYAPVCGDVTHLVELGLDVFGGLPTSRLELLRSDADVLHVGAQHEVHQVLVAIVDVFVLGILLEVRTGFESCNKNAMSLRIVHQNGMCYSGLSTKMQSV